MSNSIRADVTIARAGEFFMYCLWLQGQMADLIIFRKHPELVSAFVADPMKIPQAVVTRRATYWALDFVTVRKEFESTFRDLLTPEQLEDIRVVFHLRNIIGHSHVSVGRDYLLYRPSNLKKEHEVVSALGLQPEEDPATPTMMTLHLYDDARYMYEFNRIKRLDEICFSRLAKSIGVPHGRIR